MLHRADHSDPDTASDALNPHRAAYQLESYQAPPSRYQVGAIFVLIIIVGLLALL